MTWLRQWVLFTLVILFVVPVAIGTALHHKAARKVCRFTND